MPFGILIGKWEITFKSVDMPSCDSLYVIITTYMLTLIWKVTIGLCENNRGNGNEVDELLAFSKHGLISGGKWCDQQMKWS